MENSVILIVEDERIIAEDIKRTLINFGYEIAGIVSSGEVAIQKVQECQPDLVLMDIMLEGSMNGIQAAAKIRELYNIPVIYLTAYANENTLQSAKITEPFGYIIKPFEERELHATIEMAFYRYKIENALQRKTVQQEQLLESARHLTSSLDVKMVLANIGNGAKSILNAHSCSIYLLETDQKTLTPVVAIDPEYEEEIMATPLFLENSFTGQAVKARKSMIFNFSESQEVGAHIPGTPVEEDEHVIVAPFTVEKEILGAMCLSRTGKIYTEEELVLADAFATYAATALKNAQTHRALQNEIEERQLAERKLSETQFRLTSIFTNVPNIILYEKYGGKEFISENIRSLLGYHREDLLSRKIRVSQIMHPDDQDIVKKKFSNWFTSGNEEFLNLWYRLRKADGSYIWIEDRMVLIQPEKGKKYITGVMIDNTTLKQAEEALKESQLLYKGVVEDQSELIIRFQKDGTLIFINQAYCRYYDTDNRQVIGKNWFTLFSSGEQEEIKGKIADLNQSQPIAYFEHQDNFTEQDIRWLEWTIRAIFDDQGHIMEYQAVGRNITDSKLAEAEKEKIMNQLIQSQKMEVVGRLAGGIAHDFNNLLTAINGYAEIAKNKLESNSPIRKDIEVVQSCGEKAANLTRQLLTFSRKQIVEPKNYNLNNIILEMDKMLRRLIGEDIAFTTDPGPDLKAVKVDKGQLEQVLTNLVVNARDAVEEGGRVVVSTRNCLVESEISTVHNKIEPGEYVQLIVKDNGSGMSEEVQTHIFEPFFTTKDQGKGTGLGLATVFGIIKQNNGYILIDSQVGSGTEFKIFFKASAEQAVITKVVLDDDDLPGGDETILLTEDEDSIREFVLDILEEYGYKILEAENGEQALQMAENYAEPIHLLLTDVVMPSMNGQQLAEALRHSHPETRVIFMSGYTESTAIQKGVLELKSGFLQKPFSASDIIFKVRTILDS